jgi:FkbM family methyltransferase
LICVTCVCLGKMALPKRMTFCLIVILIFCLIVSTQYFLTSVFNSKTETSLSIKQTFSFPRIYECTPRSELPIITFLIGIHQVLWSVPNYKHTQHWINDAKNKGYVRDEAIMEWPSLLAKQLTLPSLFIDIGANVGTISLPVAGIGHTVIAVEPVLYNVALLCESMMLNGFGDGYHLLAGAASDRWLNGTIWVPEDNRQDNAAISEHLAIKNIGGKAHAQATIFFPLQDYLNRMEYPIGGLKIVKLDTRGSELFALKGLEKTFKKSNNLVVIVENDRGLTTAAGVPQTAVYEFMHGLGFEAYCDIEFTVSKDNQFQVKKGNPTINPECYDVTYFRP